MKIFCLGFNKTGTSSLHELFALNGLRSKHNIRWPHYSHITGGKLYFQLFDAYSDGERSNFVRLHRWFPNAFFIYNDRDESKWIRSRIHHFLNHKADTEPTIKNFFTNRKYGHDVAEMKVCPEKSIDYWVTNYRAYKELTLTYFADEDRFIHVNVTDDKDWQDKIHSLFKKYNVHLKRTDSLAKFNKSPKENTNHHLVDKYMSYYFNNWG